MFCCQMQGLTLLSSKPIKIISYISLDSGSTTWHVNKQELPPASHASKEKNNILQYLSTIRLVE